MDAEASEVMLPGFLVQAIFQVLHAEGALVGLPALGSAMAGTADDAIAASEVHAVLQSLAREHRDDSIGLWVGKRIQEPNLHVMGVLLSTSRTMHDAYLNCLRLLKRMRLAHIGSLQFDGSHVSYAFRSRVGELLEDLVLSLAYHAVGRFLDSTQSALSERDKDLSISFARPRPAHAATVERMFSGRVSYDAEVTKLAFPRALLDLRRPGADVALATDVRETALRHVAATSRDDSWASRVETALRGRTELAQVDYEAVARRWGVSVRSLRRRIAAEGTTLSSVLEKVRFERARCLLEQTAAPLAQIAESLGYSDETSFRRAFKRWAGVSPGDHRARTRA